MGHNHNHAGGSNKKVLLISFIMITGYMIIEAIGGFLTNSLALLSDAGHMLSDSISLMVALIAFKLAEKKASHHKTFGYKRFEILAAVINGVALILISLYIIYEAIKRFSHPPEVATTGMLTISIIGLAVNILVAWIMLNGGDTKNNLNIRGAYLHVISDMLGSVGAILAAILIIFFGWSWADPVASVIVAILVLRSGYHVTKDSIHVLMEGTPENIDVTDIIHTIEETEGIQSIHDLHIWSITSGLNALSCHAVVNDQLTISESESILRKIEHELGDKGITHVTIQMETAAHNHDNTILCQAQTENPRDHHHH
ncbi:cation diffusion facilitator family transporter [Bacillus velezensis]|uniref:cation diffusion facilitator family transporter n=1 Tax=Bacillus TaxID=1386 RepID=UPI0007A5C8CF|nr:MULTISPECIES: cation diffusion facilitator family transporter [Bacillus amyloliquefaciens group]ASS62151.1 Cadmium, cobalt and zinc/H(+)-K(+) antiporter [Bacillus velezensis]ATC51877.1 Cadmium, cobalt and zinc/H(+)-K(+) antiporter [Bacillus velezensis]MCW5195827.1 Cadmium, cobalt and zinc/H(+)-K(+) antiporter [Bacillus amyloliquefaciens]MEC3770334.1 cation diffusion facilitator family transporter [Bacillus velezensis]QOC80252.1 cation transporter [Bacillus velezensis]